MTCKPRLLPITLAGILLGSWAQSGVAAVEVPISGVMPGNQQNPAVSLTAQGGFAVWQDDRIDGRGWGIALRRIGLDLQPEPTAPVLVNAQKTYDQQLPVVACLPDGSAIVAWQGGRRGQRDIYYRKVSERGTWLTDEAYVNMHRTGDQTEPSVVALPGGDSFVSWTSQNEGGSYRGIFGRRILAASAGSPEQTRLSSPSGREDHSAVLAPLAGNGFVCSWVSGSRRYWRTGEGTPGDSVVVARVFNNLGQPNGEEVVVSDDGGAAADCSVAATSDGFVVVWFDRNKRQGFFRVHDKAGVALGGKTAMTAQSHYASGMQVFAEAGTVSFVWSDRLATDRSERIYAREFSLDSGLLSDVSAVSTSATSTLRAVQPILSGDGAGHVYSVWSGYKVGSAFDVVGAQIR